LERAIMQLYWIAFAFHGEPQDITRQLVWLHRRVANRLERKPCFIESRLQDDERLRIEGAAVEPAHGSIPFYYFFDSLSVGAKLAKFVT
jgi:hypothetical protein